MGHFGLPRGSLDIPIRNLALCLITGTIVAIGLEDDIIVDNHPNMVRQLVDQFGKQSAVFLVLTGSHATRVVDNPDVLTFMKGIYVDAYNEEDIGLKLGRVLKLSDERLEVLRESFLSGNYKDRISIHSIFDNSQIQ